MMFYFIDFRLDAADLLIGTERIVARDAFDFDLSQFDDVLARYLTLQHRLEWSELPIDGFEHALPGGTLFDGVIDAIFDEDPFERRHVPLFGKFTEPNLQFTFEKPFGIFDRTAQHITHTDKQRLFCLHYVRCFNATKAYQKAYECDYISAMQNGSRMLRNDKVKSEILRLKKERFNKDLLSEEDIFQKYMDIAFADITDYVSFGTRQAVDGKTGEEYETSFVHLKDSREVDGTLISEVSKGKDGAKIKLADRMKALQWLSGHMDMATEEQKARIGLLKLQQKKIEQENSSGYDDGVEIVNDAPKKED